MKVIHKILGAPQYIVKSYQTGYAVYDTYINDFLCNGNQLKYRVEYLFIYLTKESPQNICDILNKDGTLYDETIINYLHKDDKPPE